MTRPQGENPQNNRRWTQINADKEANREWTRSADEWRGAAFARSRTTSRISLEGGYGRSVREKGGSRELPSPIHLRLAQVGLHPAAELRKPLRRSREPPAFARF